MKRFMATLSALVRLVIGNIDLLYLTLPRSLRKGYRSPWKQKEEGLSG